MIQTALGVVSSGLGVGRVDVQAIHFPSGDQRGARPWAREGSPCSKRLGFSFSLITQSWFAPWANPPAFPAKTMLSLSGLTPGRPAQTSAKVVSCANCAAAAGASLNSTPSRPPAPSLNETTTTARSLG